MILITGGAFQGKRSYVRETLGISDILEGSECSPEQAKSAACIADYHMLVKRLTENGISAEAFTEELCRSDVRAVIINEVGSGIIPMERSERIYRETVGRCSCILAREADKVVRICCGIPQTIKDREDIS